MKISAIDLFSGVGGVSLGLSNSGFNVVACVEIDKNAVETYKKQAKFKNVNVINKDIKEITGKELLNKAKIKENEIFLLAGCPPCQNFSNQNRNGFNMNEKDKSELINEFLRLIKQTNAPLVLMENVPGIKGGINKPIFDKFITELEKNYYVVYDILNAADYGVPQTRKRFVLHAIRNDLKNLGNINHPLPTYSKDGENNLDKWTTVRDAISDLPPITAGEEYQDEIIKNHKSANLAEINIKRIMSIRKNGGNRVNMDENLKLKCHKNYKGHSDVYGIMDWDKPSPTLTGGCLSYSKGRYGHPEQDRAISIREAARIQTFPDDFIFENQVSIASLQIGNAVPVKLVEVSGKVLFKAAKQIIKKTNQ